MWDNNSVLQNIYINSIEEGPSLGYVHLASYQTNFQPADKFDRTFFTPTVQHFCSVHK